MDLWICHDGYVEKCILQLRMHGVGNAILLYPHLLSQTGITIAVTKQNIYMSSKKRGKKLRTHPCIFIFCMSSCNQCHGSHPVPLFFTYMYDCFLNTCCAAATAATAGAGRTHESLQCASNLRAGWMVGSYAALCV